MNILEARQLTFSYDGKRNIFENLDLAVAPGQIRCIIGPNGCGKTTLIDCLLGLNVPAEGGIYVAEAGSDGGMKNIRDMKAAELAAHIAYVPQGHRTTFGFTVLDVVTMGRTYAQKMFSPPGKEERIIARQALERVGLTGFEDRDYTRISGGELQLVIIARAIAQQARVLVMDEPTAHLDFRHELQVMEVVSSLVREDGLSVIMATHFLNQAFDMEYAGVDTHVSLMADGHFACEGTPHDVLTEKHLEDAFGIRAEIINSGGRTFIRPTGLTG